MSSGWSGTLERPTRGAIIVVEAMVPLRGLGAFVVAATVWSSLTACAQQQPPPRREHAELQPVASWLTYHTPEYLAELRRVLLRDGPDPRESGVRVLVRPSFECESLLTLHRTDAGWHARLVRAESPIWDAVYEKRTIDATKRSVRERAIPDAVAARITGATTTMLLRTRYEHRDAVHLDGVTHTFLGWKPGIGDLQGETNSPAAGSRPDLLVKLADACIAFVLADDAAAGKQLAAVEAALAKLEEALAALPADAPVKR